MELIFGEYLDRLVDPFLNPQKRVFVGYMAAALSIAFVVQWRFAGDRPVKALRRLFDRQVWWSRSARLDYKIIIFMVYPDYIKVVFKIVYLLQTIKIKPMVIPILSLPSPIQDL